MKTFRFVLGVSLVFAVWQISSSLAWGAWTIQTVDSEGDVGHLTSIALDSSGYPHISYYGNTDVKYARWNGSGWIIETVDSQGSVQPSSIALDSSGYPHISYYDDTNDDLKYARWNGSSWITETVDSQGNVGRYSSLALDFSNYPHISYYDATNSDLKYAQWNGSSWDTQTVDNEGDVGYWTSIALDSSGYPHISYWDNTNSALKHGQWNGSSWDIQTVDNVIIVDSLQLLALDSSGYPHISYYDDTNDDLKYARWNGSSWITETVDSQGNVGRYSSLALDFSNYPHISYYDATNSDLKYAQWNGSSWDTQTVDNEGDVGRYSSLALDSSNYPHISYRDHTNGNLKYARWAANQLPTASFTYSPESPTVSQEITFDASSSTDPDGQIVSYEWDWNNDGTYDESTSNSAVTHSWSSEGTYQVGLRVTDNDEATDATSKDVTIVSPVSILKKYAPVLYLHPDEQFYPWGIESMLDKADLWLINIYDNPIATMPVTIDDLTTNNTTGAFLDLKDYEVYTFQGDIPTEEVWEGKYPFKVYGRYYQPPDHPNKIVLQYWFFYPFNEWKFNHEGDWEMAQVVLDKTTEDPTPVKLCLGFHHDGRQYPWASIKNQNIQQTHPQIFVAEGSHGCWATSGTHRPSSSAWLPDETSQNGIVLHPDEYALVDISSEPSWAKWLGKWGDIDQKIPGSKGPDSPVNIDYRKYPMEKFLRWKEPVEWGDSLKEEGDPWHSQYIAYTESTLLDIVSLHAYDESKLHVGETETGEIQVNIPGTYFYVPSYASDDQKEWMWIDSSGNLRFEIKSRSGASQSLHTKGGVKKTSNFLVNPYQSPSSGEFNFAFNRYLQEQDLNLTVTYQDVPFTENTIAIVDVNPENPMFTMQIDKEVRYPSYIEGLVADIQATINIDPDTLNLKSKGKWITSYIELPAGYDVNNIRIDTILLMINESVITPAAQSSPSEVNDYDENGIPDLMVKFDRAALIAYLQDNNLTTGQVTLRVIGQVRDKIFEGTDTITIKGGTVAKSMVQPKFDLSQNYPNPCNPETTIEYSLAEGCNVTLKIYNIAGQLVKTLVDEYQQAGYYKIMWHGDNDGGQEVASGVYFYRIKAGDFVSTKKMVVLK